MLLRYASALTPVIAILYGYNTLSLALRVGLAGGILWVLEIGMNNFIAPPLPLCDILDNIFWGVIALIILTHCGWSAFRASSIRTGIEAGNWSGFVSGILACCMALNMIVFGMFFITQDPLNITEWAVRGTESGTPSMAAYFAFETLAGGLMHLLNLGLIMGLLLGMIGGVLGRATQFISQRLKAM